MSESRHTTRSGQRTPRYSDKRPCDYCGGLFQPRQENQRFHPGGRCKAAYYAERDAAARDLTKHAGGKNPAAVALGRLGGLARARKLREMGW